jgi:hypothetical protein
MQRRVASEVEQANKAKKTQLADWYDAIIDGAALAKTDPRLMFRKTMFAMARKPAGVLQRRRDTREHVALYLKAFNAWATGETLTQLRLAAREPVRQSRRSLDTTIIERASIAPPANKC